MIISWFWSLQNPTYHLMLRELKSQPTLESFQLFVYDVININIILN